MRSLLFILIIALFPFILFAQHDIDTLRSLSITLYDGTIYNGSLLSEDSTKMQLMLSNGAVIIAQKESIQRILYYQKSEKDFAIAGSASFYDPHGHRLMIMPTARTLKKKQGFIANSEIFFLSGGYGISDNIMVTAGSTIIPGLNYQYYFVAPKVRMINLDFVDISFGGIYSNLFHQGGGEDDGGIVTGFGVATYNLKKGALSFGLAFPYIRNSDRIEPVVMVSGEVFTTLKSKIIIETWNLPGTEGLFVLFGVRTFGPNLSGDFGFLGAFPFGSSNRMPFFPWINIAYTF